MRRTKKHLSLALQSLNAVALDPHLGEARRKSLTKLMRELEEAFHSGSVDRRKAVRVIRKVAQLLRDAYLDRDRDER